MEPLHTHYDNLKVTRNAPPEVIKAAYKAMAQKWHPDRNQGRSDAERIMKIVNEAYATLIDPIKRKEHDQWIAKEEEQRKATFAKPGPRPGPGPHAASATHTRPQEPPPAPQPRPTPEPDNTSPYFDTPPPPPQAPGKSNSIFSSLTIPLTLVMLVWVFTGTTSNKEARSNSSPSHTSPPAPSATQSTSKPLAPTAPAEPRQVQAEKPEPDAVAPVASPTPHVATAQTEPESEMEPGDPATCPSTVTLNVQSSGYSGRIDVELRVGPRPGSMLVRRGHIMSTGTLRFANVCNADALFFAFGTPDSDTFSVTRSFSVKATESSYNNPEITVYYSREVESGNKRNPAKPQRPSRDVRQ